jgi:hypothetical protein
MQITTLEEKQRRRGSLAQRKKKLVQARNFFESNKGSWVFYIHEQKLSSQPLEATLQVLKAISSFFPKAIAGLVGDFLFLPVLHKYTIQPTSAWDLCSRITTSGMTVVSTGPSTASKELQYRVTKANQLKLRRSACWGTDSGISESCSVSCDSKGRVTRDRVRYEQLRMNRSTIYRTSNNIYVGLHIADVADRIFSATYENMFSPEHVFMSLYNAQHPKKIFYEDNFFGDYPPQGVDELEETLHYADLD